MTYAACLATVLLAIALGSAPALAQQTPPLPPGNTLPKSAPTPTVVPGVPVPQPPGNPAAPRMAGGAFVPVGNGSTQAYNDAMSKMMADMGKPYSGDADRDFASHMVPHHQGAIDMAEAELKFGHDPKMKQLAARIISAQQREIAFMQAWLEKHPFKDVLRHGPNAAQLR